VVEIKENLIKLEASERGFWGNPNPSKNTVAEQMKITREYLLEEDIEF